MDVRRGVAMGLVGLALVIGSTGCTKIGEKVAEEAIERNTDCEGVEVDAEGQGFTGNCGGDQIDVSGTGQAELPPGWPVELATPEGLRIATADELQGPPRTITVVGTVDGDITAVYDQVKAQLTAAGFTIEHDTFASPGGGSLTGTGADLSAGVLISDVVGALEGDLSVTYTLTEI